MKSQLLTENDKQYFSEQKEKMKKEIEARKESNEERELIDKVTDLIIKKRSQEACYKIAEFLSMRYTLITLSDTKQIYIYRGGVYLPIGEEILLKEIQFILTEFCKNHFVNEVFGHIKRMTIKNRKEIKEPSDKICLENGILNLDTLEIEPHNRLIIFFNKLSVEYNRSADCIAIKKFLSEIVASEDIKLLQEFTGYCLFKEHFIHKAFMLVGGGANGKSTFLNLLKSFLGQENVASVPLQRLENNRFSLSSLFGKLANIFADLPSRALSGTSIFKMLVGQDLVPAEKKFMDEFFFENYAKLIFSANQIPKTPEDNDAFFRRWIIINFPNQFLDNADKHLIKKLTTKEELSGFLNFALDGLKELLAKGEFSKTNSIQKAREQYIRMSDSVASFVMDNVESHPDSSIAKKELYTAYCDYCRAQNYPISAENTFHKELQTKIRIEDYRPLLEREGKKERVQCWKGIKVNNKTNPDDLDKPDKDKVKDVNDVKVESLHKSNPQEEELLVSYERV